jgi:putative transposase
MIGHVPPVEHEQTYYAQQAARQDPKAGERSLH